MPALREFLSVRNSEKQELQESGVRSTHGEPRVKI
jgi:hypothetical protein